MVTDSPSWLSDLGIAIPPRGQQVRFGLGELDEAGARVRTNRVRGAATYSMVLFLIFTKSA